MMEAARIIWVIQCSVRILLVDVRWCPMLAQAEEAFSESVASNEAHRFLMDVAQLPAFDEYSWMWGDAGQNILGHGLAELDFFRWSEWKNSAATLRDLEAYEGTAFFGRTVEMMGVKGAGTHIGPHPTMSDMTRDKMLFSSVGESINYLRMQTKKDYSWMWGDAGKNILGHRIAELDPFRWSDWQSAEKLLRDLNYKKSANPNRPVEIREDGGKKISFPNIDAAINFLAKQAKPGAAPSSPSPAAVVPPTNPPAPRHPIPRPTSAPRPAPRPAPAVKAKPGAAPSSPSPAAVVPPTNPPALRHPIPRPTSAPRPAPRPAPAVKASDLPTPAPHQIIVDHSEATLNLTAKTTARLLLLAAVVGLLGCCAFLGCCILQAAGSKNDRRKRVCSKEAACGPSSSDDEDAESPSPSRRGRSITDGELYRLLAEVDAEDQERLALTGSASQADLPRKAEAEVERILATQNVEDIFGQGTVVEQKIQYRRLVRMLHPDKGLVNGEKATLALRRVVEHHTVLMTSQG